MRKKKDEVDEYSMDDIGGIKKLYSAILERAILDCMKKYETGKWEGNDPEKYIFYDDPDDLPELPEFLAICDLIEVSPTKIRRSLISYKNKRMNRRS